MAVMRTGVSWAAFLALGVGVSVAAAASPAKAPLTTRTVNFGQSLTLKAKSSLDAAPPNADVLSRPCGFTAFSSVASPKLAADGSVAYRASPTLNTLFRVLIADREVLNVNVLVRPAITIRRVSGKTFHVEVTTGNGAGLGKHTVLLQQRSAAGKWSTVGSVRLKLISKPADIHAVAVGNGKAATRGSGRVRAMLTEVQARPCFAPVASTGTS
jgi:hypothetical protein